MSTDLNAIADQLSSLTVMEAAELASLLEEKWGVSAAAAQPRRTRQHLMRNSWSSCAMRPTARSRASSR